MASTTQRRLVNPMLGIYFGIFTSLAASLVMMLLVLERLGVSDGLLRLGMLVGPIALFIGIGVAAYCQDPPEILAAGRRVPAVYTGLVLALSALGGTGLVAGTGLFALNGMDAWCIGIGTWAGFVAMALLVAPFLRKHGAYTVPSYLGRRLDNRLVRIVAAGVLLVPMLLIAVAELKVAAFAASWLSGWSEGVVTQLLVFAVLPMLVLGGVRSLTWTNAAQAIAALIALVVPVGLVAAVETSLPLPQLSHGPVLRAIGRLEAIQGVPINIAPALALDFAGQDLTTIASRMAQPYTSVGPIAFLLMIVTIACGIAGAPWLLPRTTYTPGVYDTRKSSAWAIVFSGLVVITGASVAVLFRDILMDQVVGRAAGSLPGWFRHLVDIGMANLSGTPARIALTDVQLKRDAVLFALPVAAGFSPVVLYMALAGAVAAALLAATSAITAMANMLAEDGVGGLVWTPAPAMRVSVVRLALPVVAIFAGWIAIFVPADPLDLMLWGLALSGSACFPVLVLSILWKRLNAFGALVGMVAGFVTALLSVMIGEAASLGLPGALAAVLGIPAAFVGAAVATRIASLPDRHVLALLRDIRLPGGETIYDREERLQRMKQQRSA